MLQKHSSELRHGEVRGLHVHRALQHQLPGLLPALLQSDAGAAGALHGRGVPRPAGAEVLQGEIQRVGPDDHHPAGALPGLGGRHQAGGVAGRPGGRGGLLHRHAALRQPALQLREPLPALPAGLQAAPQGEGPDHLPPRAVGALPLHLPRALLLQLPVLHGRRLHLLHPLLLPHDAVRLPQGLGAAGRLRRALPPDQRGVGGLLRRHAGGRPHGRGVAGGARQEDGREGRRHLAGASVAGRRQEGGALHAGVPHHAGSRAGADGGGVALRGRRRRLRGVRGAQRRRGGGRPDEPRGLSQLPAALLLLLLLALLLAARLALLPAHAALPAGAEEAAALLPAARRRLPAAGLEVHRRAQVPAGRQPPLPLLRVEEGVPAARAGALPPGAGLRLRRLELPGRLPLALALLGAGLPGLPAGRHRAAEAAGVPLLHRAVPDVPAAHAAAVAAAAAAGVPAVRRRQRRHHLRLHRQDLPLAGQRRHAEVHVVTRSRLDYLLKGHQLSL